MNDVDTGVLIGRRYQGGEMSMCVRHVMMIALAAGSAWWLAAAESSPLPWTPPEDISPFLGDPDRGPEPSDQHRQQSDRQIPTIEVSWPINVGNPFTDWGHFRLDRRVTGARRGPGSDIRMDVPSRNRDEVAAYHGRFTTRAWGDGALLRYSIMVPDPQEAPRPEGGYPLVISCPGAGGVGEEGLASWRLHGAAVWANDHYRRQMPAVVVILHPQHRTISYTGEDSEENWGIKTLPAFDAYLELIDHYAAADGIDPRRISVYGHSMGGSSVWALVRARPRLFAAAVPLAGSPFSQAADYPLLNGTPMWIMMGNNDPWNGSKTYLMAYRAMRAAGHQQVRFWEIQDIGHSGSALTIMPVHQWMWSQVREE